MKDKVGSSNRKGVHLMINKDLWKKVRVQALLEGKSTYDWAEEAFQEKLNNKPAVK